MFSRNETIPVNNDINEDVLEHRVRENITMKNINIAGKSALVHIGKWRRGKTWNVRPPPETGKIVVGKCCYLPKYILSEKRQKSRKYLVKIKKSKFYIEILIKKSQTFLKNFP